MARSELKIAVINEIVKPTARDKQKKIGPSELGNPCPKCIGRALAGERQEQEFSLYPWLGTAGHAYLETTTFPDAQHELRVRVGEIKGYGDIWGTTDLYMDGQVIDWKFVGLKKIKEYRVKGAPDVYRYQAMNYGVGCVAAGLPVESVAIVFIPRDSGNVNDIFVYEEEFQPEMAAASLARAEKIWEIVQEEGWENLPESDDCFNCRTNWR